ncbi:hypothetical protein KM043_017929 [Ampulex compressa]|nr:hypothetical protein KM043_017929 [Ampulex compressa]
MKNQGKNKTERITKNTNLSKEVETESVQGVCNITLRLFILWSCIKTLLIPTYHSTDFEVHRNWLALTHSLPIKEWYTDNKSQWTLDYPPFFAWFEFFLSQAAQLFDPAMLQTKNLNYVSENTVLLQRISVICADIALLYGVKELGKVFCKTTCEYSIFAVLSLCNIGLLIVDHVHFQYNGFLLGILLLSVARLSKVQEQSLVLKGAAWFTVLLNLKHIYLYVAPAVTIWLFVFYCLANKRFFRRLFFLGLIVLLITAISFGPFWDQIHLILARLFPFKRGLLHSYWAANFWALYAGVDKLFTFFWKKLGWLKITETAVMTNGLVQEQSFVVLPTPKPGMTFVLTLITILPCLWLLFSKRKKLPEPRDFLRCIIICGLSSFLFGWHVHEKAILTSILPFCVLAAVDVEDAKFFAILSSTGQTSLLPLLYPENLLPLKLFLSILHLSAIFLIFSRKYGWKFLDYHEYAYICILPFLTLYETTFHRFLFQERMPFLPLAITSIYCSFGIIYCWLFLYYRLLFKSN